MLKIKQKQKEISIKWNSCKLIADLRRSDQMHGKSLI